MKSIVITDMRKIWITGASSGIGEACAYEYAGRGDFLVLTSSSEERLEAVAEESIRLGASGAEVLPYDFSQNDGIVELTEQAWSMTGGVDVLFLNAGISQRTSVEDTSMEMVRKIMEVDFFAPVALAKAVLPRMVASGGGSIAVTTSIAGRFGFPLRCGYSSAKHALYGFFETVQAEYGSKGIHVTIVCPGRVRTGISLRALDKGGAPHGKMDPGQDGGISPQKAARKIVRTIDAHRREVLVGGRELLMVYIKRFLPGLCARLAARIKPM